MDCCFPFWPFRRGVYATISYALEDGQYKDAGKRVKFIQDGRSAFTRTRSLETDGFCLTTLPLERTAGHDLFNYLETSKALYPLAEEVLKRTFPCCTKVLVFDHIARHDARYAKEAAAGEITKMLASGPAFSVHGDYTVRSGFTRLQSLMKGYEAEQRIDEVLKQRFAFVNVWVPLKKVERDPLGLIEWSSQRPCDVVTVKFIYPHRTGETYRVMPSDLHRWVYYPDMLPGECLVFKVFDSSTDGRARFSLHGAFQDPTSRPDAASRQSIEYTRLMHLPMMSPWDLQLAAREVHQLRGPQAASAAAAKAAQQAHEDVLSDSLDKKQRRRAKRMADGGAGKPGSELQRAAANTIVAVGMRCVVFFDVLPEGFGDTFVAPHLLPGTDCIMNPERVPAKHLGQAPTAFLRQTTDQTLTPKPVPHYEVVVLQKAWKLRPGNRNLLEALALLMHALRKHSRCHRTSRPAVAAQRAGGRLESLVVQLPKSLPSLLLNAARLMALPSRGGRPPGQMT
ncbi:Hydroxylase/desaturase CTB9 (Cercosporin toxin biosynthesis cluster protein 9) [Durusdinium trenchii]|uniref:Hydroxylase/desaturase CTB9 (Cercosporin toxin biosynthesis cluster protein 9) n=1 Tax=Durusdinium trenchii TaxID=1381693 RepID=A0ABP0KTU7_9DINO